MKSKLKSIFTQKGAALQNYSPEVVDKFHVLLHIAIGPEDQEGSHSYSLGVCTPKWLDHACQHEGAVWGRHLLVVNDFDSAHVIEAIEKMIACCDRADWEKTSFALSRFFSWEYEDFRGTGSG